MKNRLIRWNRLVISIDSVMKLRDLKYFVTVADTGHFGRAADLCHVSQPTLSGQIKKLEEQLGTPLFERTSRRVIVTDTGRKISTLARRILSDAAEIEEIALLSRNPTAGRFSLGAIPTLSPFIFPDLVQSVKSRLPNLKLILHETITENLMDKLRHGQLDAILVALPIDDDLFEVQQLFEDPFYLAVPTDHPLAGSKVIDQESLQDLNILLLEEGHCLRDQALEICGVNAIEEEQDFRATSIETLRQMIKAGTGITFMPEISIRQDEEGVCIVPLHPTPTRSIGLVWRKTTARQPVIDEIINLLFRPTVKMTEER